MRPEVPLGKAAHGRAAPIKKAFVDRNLRRRSPMFQTMNDSRARAKGEQTAMVREARLRFVADRQKVSEARSAPDEIDVTADRTGGEIQSVIEDETAAWVHFAVPQIKRLCEPD